MCEGCTRYGIGGGDLDCYSDGGCTQFWNKEVVLVFLGGFIENKN